MKNLLLLSDDPLDQCSFYRLWPFAEFRRNIHVTVKRVQDFQVHDALAADVVFLLRPHSGAHLSIMQAVRQLGRQVWIDYDDDFLNLAPHQHWAEVFGSYPQRKRFEAIAGLASCFTVSTRPIAESWFMFSPTEIRVIPNVFNDSLYAIPPEHNRDSNVIVWRGTYSHVKDLELIAQAAEQFPEYRFVFMGSFHHTMPARFPKATFYPFMPMAQYFQTLKELKPRLFLVPLEDTPFNRSKSNCSWLEATHAGAAVLASSLPEFRRPGIYLVTPKANWCEQIKLALDDSEILFRASVKDLEKTYLLSDVNAVRTQLLADLTQG